MHVTSPERELYIVPRARIIITKLIILNSRRDNNKSNSTPKIINNDDNQDSNWTLSMILRMLKSLNTHSKSSFKQTSKNPSSNLQDKTQIKQANEK